MVLLNANSPTLRPSIPQPQPTRSRCYSPLGEGGRWGGVCVFYLLFQAKLLGITLPSPRRREKFNFKKCHRLLPFRSVVSLAPSPSLSLSPPLCQSSSLFLANEHLSPDFSCERKARWRPPPPARPLSSFVSSTSTLSLLSSRFGASC